MTPTEKQAFHIKWLKFAILLSQTNFEELTAGQRLDLRATYSDFVNSTPDRQQPPLSVLQSLRGADIPVHVAEIIGEADANEEVAGEILARHLSSLADSINVGVFSGKTAASFGIGRMGDAFYFVTVPYSAKECILALLGYHLTGSGISASMLRRCPACQRVFLVERKPRTDRNLYCSTRCSGKAATDAHRARMKELPRALRLKRSGKSIEAIAKLTGLDHKWLEGKLTEKRRARKRISGAS